MMKLFFLYNIIGFKTLLKKEVKRFFKVYIQTLLAPLLSNVLFLGVFGGVFKTRDVGIEGVGYLAFIVPGLAGMGTIFSAFQNPAYSILTLKYQNTIQDLNTYPLSIFEKTMGFVLGGVIRGVIVGVLTYLATIYFVGASIAHPFVFFFTLLMLAFVFSALGVVVGLAVDSFEKISFILTIILTPLTYFGGVFFEVSKLPGILSKVAYLNPLFPLINVVRYGYLGVYEGNMVTQLFFIGGIVSIAYYSAYLMFKKGVGITQ